MSFYVSLTLYRVEGDCQMDMALSTYRNTHSQVSFSIYREVRMSSVSG